LGDATGDALSWLPWSHYSSTRRYLLFGESCFTTIHIVSEQAEINKIQL
jgi:hypothetical protein